MATQMGGFPYNGQNHLENIRRIGSQTFLLVWRQLGTDALFSGRCGRTAKSRWTPSRFCVGVCIVGAGGFGLIRTRVSRVGVFSRT